nr:hypothetical protein [uncultured Lachnoclostridium sp.]
MKNVYRMLMELLKESTSLAIMQLHNTYCEKNRYDDYIYFTDDVEEMIRLQPPRSILRKVGHKDFDFHDRFFWEEFGKYVSFDDINDGEQVYFDDIVKYILDNDDDLGDAGIRDILEYDGLIHSDSEDITVEGHSGTWYVINETEVNDEKFFLLEHEEYGDTVAAVAVNEQGELVAEDLCNGFAEDFKEAVQEYFEEKETER